MLYLCLKLSLPYLYIQKFNKIIKFIQLNGFHARRALTSHSHQLKSTQYYWLANNNDDENNNKEEVIVSIKIQVQEQILMCSQTYFQNLLSHPKQEITVQAYLYQKTQQKNGKGAVFYFTLPLSKQPNKYRSIYAHLEFNLCLHLQLLTLHTCLQLTITKRQGQ